MNDHINSDNSLSWLREVAAASRGADSASIPASCTAAQKPPLDTDISSIGASNWRAESVRSFSSGSKQAQHAILLGSNLLTSHTNYRISQIRSIHL